MIKIAAHSLYEVENMGFEYDEVYDTILVRVYGDFYAGSVSSKIDDYLGIESPDVHRHSCVKSDTLEKEPTLAVINKMVLAMTAQFLDMEEGWYD